MHVDVGDEIEVVRSGHGGAGCRGVVLEVRSTASGELYRVRWRDGTQTFYRPAGDVRVLARRGS